ncbi:hypothetical protein KIW84_040246 [Lathyrus oleraceus]|uniref:Uncharacterized protein n=1 Tax=Pisum sativum TaxID=3888 RepID=A0A9D5AQK2_PEA|nr:hypothetical protein KIW84_040246 [Pisum sativum]
MQQSVLSQMLRESTETKIRYLEITFFVEEEILRLKITVVNTATVTEINRGNQLLEIDSSNVFLKTTFDDFVEKLTATNEFHGDVDLRFRSHHFMDLNYVRVFHHLHH